MFFKKIKSFQKNKNISKKLKHFTGLALFNRNFKITGSVNPGNKKEMKRSLALTNPVLPHECGIGLLGKSTAYYLYGPSWVERSLIDTNCPPLTSLS